MASLKKIMNLDEDSSDPVQVKRERSASSISTQVPTTQTSSSSSTTTSFSGSTSTASRHISLRDQPFARPPRQISSPSAYMAYSQSSDSPALSSPSSSTTSRRSRSSISTGADTMDAMHYPQDHYSSNYGYASSSSYSDPASRGYSTVPATGVPVKYTPITGRVSRAKKGYPVHTCEQCRPSKTFTRAEHLRRHQLSHNPPELVCSVPGCGKTFHRKDLLERHQHRHEQDSRAVPASGSGQHDPRYHRPSQHSQPPLTTGSYVSGIPITSPPWQEVDSTDMRSNSSPSGPNYSMPINPSYNPSLGYGGPVPAWPEQDPHFMNGPEWTPRTVVYGGYPAVTTMAPDEYHPVDMCGIPMGTEPILDAHHHGNSTVRSLPPVLVEGQSPETLDIALAAALSPCPVATSQFSPCGSESRQMPNLLAAHVFAPVSLSRATQSDIPAYLEVYWARTYPVYPYIHRASFDGPLDGEATPFELLKCAMAALATQFLDDRKHRIAGSELHTFACQELKTFTDGKHWSLPIMQAVVCCEYYARFRGRDKQSYKPSSNYRKVYELLVEKHNNFSYPLPELRNKLLSWKNWVEAETLRRLLATCFMLDVHTSAYFKEPPILALGHEHRSLPMNQVPFSTNTNQMWECTDWESWARLVASDPTLGRVIGRKLEDELTSEDVASMSGFDATILMTGYASQLMTLTGSGEMDAEDTSPSSSSPASRLAKLFPASGVAQAYLAIHFTPLHALLSVSGNSWVLNRKIPEPNEFREHTQILDKWCQSERAAMAVSWAARALLVFLRIPSTTRATAESASSSSSSATATATATKTTTSTTVNMDRSSLLAGSRAPWKDVSDYWGVYVCALICWAFGRQTQPGQDHQQRPHDATTHNQASRMVAVRWILEAAQLTPSQLLKWRRRRCTRGVICWARDVLTRDCLAGRSMLYTDAVNVLKRLGETSI